MLRLFWGGGGEEGIFFLGGVGATLTCCKEKSKFGEGGGGGEVDFKSGCVEYMWCFIPKGTLPDRMLGLQKLL